MKNLILLSLIFMLACAKKGTDLSAPAPAPTPTPTPVSVTPTPTPAPVPTPTPTPVVQAQASLYCETNSTSYPVMCTDQNGTMTVFSVAETLALFQHPASCQGVFNVTFTHSGTPLESCITAYVGTDAACTDASATPQTVCGHEIVNGELQ